MPVTIEDVAKTISDAYRRGKTHAIIINAEGSGLRTVELAERFQHEDVGFETRVTILGYIQRGGSPTAYDRLLAARMGIKAVEGLLEGVMTGLEGHDVVFVPLEDVTSNRQTTSPEFYQMTKVLAR